MAALGLTGEAGEFADMVKKLRYHNKELTPEVREHLIKELGDVLWYVAYGAKAFGVSLSTVAQINLDKLAKRYGREPVVRVEVFGGNLEEGHERFFSNRDLGDEDGQ